MYLIQCEHLYIHLLSFVFDKLPEPLFLLAFAVTIFLISLATSIMLAKTIVAHFISMTHIRNLQLFFYLFHTYTVLSFDTFTDLKFLLPLPCCTCKTIRNLCIYLYTHILQDFHIHNMLVDEDTDFAIGISSLLTLLYLQELVAQPLFFFPICLNPSL